MQPNYPLHLPILAKLNLNTPLGDLISLIEKRLPIELQTMIYDSVTGLFKSLLRTLSTLQDSYPLLSNLDDHQAPLMTHPLNASPLSTSRPVEMLYARAVSILGEACLTEISVQDDSQGSRYAITIARQPVWGVQVAYGTYGVVGLRVLYVDGFKSAWLGFGKRKLFMTCEGEDLTELQISSDVSGLE